MTKRIKILKFLIFCNIYTSAQITVLIDGKIQNSTNKITLKSGYHELIFQFQNKGIYQYKLENLENSFKNSQYSEVRYTNLSGGNYIFHGRIIENEKSKNYQIPIEIKEEIWEKWWFWLFVISFTFLGLGLIIYFWFLYDFRQKLKIEAIRNRISADLHDEVGANLNSITFLSELLRKQINKKGANIDELIDKISSNSTETATLINDTIWSLKPEFDNFEKLIERIKSFASSLLSSKDIAFSLENNLTNKNIDLPLEIRRNLYLILKESVNNVAKHSEAKKAFLRIKEYEKYIKIELEDDGNGFEKNEVYEGNGLKNFELRSIEDEIEVKVDSALNYGTKITINLNLKNH